MQKVTETQHNGIPKFDFMTAQQAPTRDCLVGQVLEENEEGPMAMSYEMSVGWVADKLGPNSGHWKRRAQAGPINDFKVKLGPIQKKEKDLPRYKS